MQHPFYRILAVLLVIGTVVTWPTRAARAQAPSNDEPGGALVFPTLPSSFAENTTEATTSSNDSGCFGAAATVWFRFTPTTDVSVLIDTDGSDYETVVDVASGSPGALTGIVCGQGRAIFDATAGTTYFIMVGAAFGGSGGNLVVTARESPFTITIEPTGTFDSKTGAATVDVQMTCEEPVFVSSSILPVTQRAGRLIIEGFAEESLQTICDPENPIFVTSEIRPFNGLYRGGRADVLAQFVIQFGTLFTILNETRTVTLRGR